MASKLKNWTEEQIETVKKMAYEKYSSSQIGAVIGKSRNSVIGFCHRNNIKLHKGIYHPRADKPFVQELPTPTIFIPRKLVKLTELKIDQCAWIVGNSNTGESKCCGKKVIKGSFCEEHSAVCYVK